MPPRHVIVDGSNLATEGRSMPSLAQLDQAVREFASEHPDDVVTVVVDASFGHRIDPSELPTFEEAEAAGEVISPPAGAIGRGDAFLLRIAEKTGATVLSNDSFQEFHGDHAWLFEKGRLIGGKPVPGVGWIFMERTPVRGQRSREVVKEAKRRKPALEDGAKPVGAKGDGNAPAAPKGKARPKSVDRAIARATQEVVEPKSDGKSRRRRGGEPPADPVNEPLAFITFIAAHPLGSEVVGTVVEFSSHGAFVSADGARCYMPLSAMGDPPPRRAREVVSRGETRAFVVQAFDPPRRGIELAVPGFAKIAGAPTEETVAAEISLDPTGRGKRRGSGRAEPAVAGDGAGPAGKKPADKKPAAKKAAPRKPADKKPADKRPADKKAAEKKPAAKRAGAAKDATAGAAARKAPATKSPAKKPPAEKASPNAGKTSGRGAGRTAGQQTPAATKEPAAAKKAPVKKAPAKGPAAATKVATAKAPATRKAAPAAKAQAAHEPEQAATANKAQKAPATAPTRSRTKKAPG